MFFSFVNVSTTFVVVLPMTSVFSLDVNCVEHFHQQLFDALAGQQQQPAAVPGEGVHT